MKNIILRWQLRQQGASAKDAKALSSVAKNVGRADSPGLSSDAKKRIAAEIGIANRWQFVTIPRLAIGGALALFAVVVAFSQSALPGTPLYSIKRGSEQVRLLVQPGFNQQDIQQRRESEQQKVEDNNEHKSGSTSKSSDDSGLTSKSGDSTRDRSGSDDSKSSSGSSTSGESGSTSGGSGSTSGGSGGSSGGSGDSGSNGGSDGTSGGSGGGSSDGGGGSGGHGGDDGR